MYTFTAFGNSKTIFVIFTTLLLGMVLEYGSNGCLTPGIHELNWEDFNSAFGYTIQRGVLISGLQRGVNDLKECGCIDIYVDGSFVTKKRIPNDYDVCWSLNGVDIGMLRAKHPLFFDFKDSRKNQKTHYYGEFFPTIASAILVPPLTYLEFFQKDRDDNPKGIIKLI